jgi:hypothetical protein
MGIRTPLVHISACCRALPHMKKIFLINIFVLLAFLTNGQNLIQEQVDSVTNSRIAQLLEEQDSILLHESGCIGCYIISDDDCNCEQYNHLYWKESTESYIQRIDCCGVHEISALDRDIWNKFELNVADILNSKFNTEHYVIHHDYDYITLATQDTILTIKIRDFYFNSNEADSASNMNQPAKIFLDYLTKESN